VTENDDLNARGGAEPRSGDAELASERAPAGRVSRPAASERGEHQEPRTVAAFDFDKTLSTRDNVLPFLRLAVGRLRLARTLALISPRLVGAAVDSKRRDAAKAALVRHTLTGYDADRLDGLGREFAADVCDRHLRPEVVAWVAWHMDHGHEAVIVSASFTHYLEPVAARLGIGAVLATELEVADDRLTGRLAGPNVRGAEKVRRLDAWLGPEPADVWAYGDSAGDDALLARADHAIRV
jgi:phosphatidylglycerophosphatase C